MDMRETTRETTPLHLAIQNGHLEIVKVLLKKRDIGHIYHGGDPCDDDDDEIYRSDLIDSIDADGNSPLLLASKIGQVEMVKVLLSKPLIKLDIVDHNWNTPLHLAAQGGHKEVARCLLKCSSIAGKEFDTDDKMWRGWLNLLIMNQGKAEREMMRARNEDEKTPLHIAAENGHHEIVEMMLQIDEINVNVECEGSTSLHLAAKNNHWKVLEVLLEHPKIGNPKDWSKKTALQIALERGHGLCVREIRKRFKK